MSHDKIRDAARRRMARTGESYATARRRVIAERQAEDVRAGDPALSAGDIRAAAAAHDELGPEYSDAVVASFLEKVEEEIAARVDARLAAAARPAAPADQDSRRTLLKGIAIDEDAERARTRMNAALEGIYGHRVPAIEAAAVTGTTADCIRAVNEVTAAGAELILFTALFDQREQMEQLAAAVLPKLG